MTMAVVVALLVLMGLGAWWFLFKKQPESDAPSHEEDAAEFSEEKIKEIREEISLQTAEIRFQFGKDPDNPQVHLTLRISNESNHEIVIDRVQWDVTPGQKSKSAARGFSCEKIVLLPQTSHDRLVLQTSIDHVEARYLSQLKEGLTLDCYVEGTLYGSVKHIGISERKTPFEKNFLSLNVPCIVENITGPLSNMHVDPTHLDPLTGLLNRRFLAENGQAMADNASAQHPLSFLMIDIDNFKAINDSHGHLIGDDVVKAVCSRIREVVGVQGFSIRYGGDEFSIALMNSDETHAKQAAVEIQSQVQKYDFKTRNGNLKITLSIGITTAYEKTDHTALIQRADDMLRASKNRGKNTISEWQAAA